MFGPENPSGEHAVEKCLDESGAKEMLAFFAFKGEAESFFESLAHSRKGGQFVKADAVESVAGVGSEEPGKVLRSGERGGVEHGALGKFLEGDFVGCSGFFGMGGGVPEIGFVLG